MKDPTNFEDYLGVQIVQSDDGKKAWLGQPKIIKSLEKQFGERVAKKEMTVTPGTPGFIGGKSGRYFKFGQEDTIHVQVRSGNIIVSHLPQQS